MFAVIMTVYNRIRVPLWKVIHIVTHFVMIPFILVYATLMFLSIVDVHYKNCMKEIEEEEG